jgi:hypothetical protein
LKEVVILTFYASKEKMKDTSFSNKINALFATKNWAEARKLLQSQLCKQPDNHWLLTRISTTFYEERYYKKALV